MGRFPQAERRRPFLFVATDGRRGMPDMMFDAVLDLTIATTGTTHPGRHATAITLYIPADFSQAKWNVLVERKGSYPC